MFKTYHRKDVPQLWRRLQSAMAGSPSLRKHKLNVFITDSVDGMTSYWDGGSRRRYHVIGVNGGRMAAPRVPTSPPQFGGGEPAEYPLTADRIVVSDGVFCGKTASFTVYLNAAAARHFGLPAG